MTPEEIFELGKTICVCGGVLSVFSVILLTIYKKNLDKKLSKDYGEKYGK